MSHFILKHIQQSNTERTHIWAKENGLLFSSVDPHDTSGEWRSPDGKSEDDYLPKGLKIADATEDQLSRFVRPKDFIKFLPREEREKRYKAAPMTIFPKGLMVFHGGSLEDTCCFFVSTDIWEADQYIVGGDPDRGISIFMLSEDMIGYEWGYTGISFQYGVDYTDITANSWDEFLEILESYELFAGGTHGDDEELGVGREAEFEVNDEFSTLDIARSGTYNGMGEIMVVDRDVLAPFPNFLTKRLISLFTNLRKEVNELRKQTIQSEIDKISNDFLIAINNNNVPSDIDSSDEDDESETSLKRTQERKQWNFDWTL